MTARRGGHDRDTRRCLAAVVPALGSLTATACKSTHRPENIVVAETDATGRSARLLSAFYGLDDNLPFGAHLLCLNTVDPVVAVAFPAGYLVDPNQDRNPDTGVDLSGRNNQGNRTPDA